MPEFAVFEMSRRTATPRDAKPSESPRDSAAQEPAGESKKGLAAVLQVTTENWAVIKFFLAGTLFSLGVIAFFIAPVFITADWVDKRLGITKLVLDSIRSDITSRVDSGYSRTFIFRAGTLKLITFYRYAPNPISFRRFQLSRRHTKAGPTR